MGYKCLRYEGGEKFSEKSEVLSFGVLLLELVVGDVTLVEKRKKNLYFHFIDDEEEELIGAFDPRAEGDSAWPDSVKCGLSGLIESCLEPKPKKRIKLLSVLRQLMQLAREHCGMSLSEKMLTAMREERQKALAEEKMGEAKKKAGATFKCLICMDEELQESKGITCPRGHFFWASCYCDSLQDELGKIANDLDLGQEHKAREGKMRCPQRQGVERCEHQFTDHQLARCLSDEEFSEYAISRRLKFGSRFRGIERDRAATGGWAKRKPRRT